MHEPGAAVALRYRQIIAAILGDLGGAKRLSEAEVQLARRFAAGSVLAERIENRALRGEKIEIGDYVFLCTALVRISQAIGRDGPKKTQKPRLADLLRRSQRREDK